MKGWISFFIKLKDFLGRDVWRLFLISAALGVAWFAIESSLVFILQGFLNALGILERSKTNLPDFYPEGIVSCVVVLVLFGLVRFGVMFSRHYFNGYASQSFIKFHRNHIFKLSLMNAALLKSSEMTTAFNEYIVKGSNVILLLSRATTNVVSAVLFMGLGLYMAPTEFIIGVTLLSTVAYPLKILNSKVRNYGSEVVTTANRLNERLSNGLRHNLFLRIHNLILPEISEAEGEIDYYETLHKKHYRIHALKTSLPLFLGILIIAAITYFSLEYLETDGVVLLTFFYVFLRFTQAVSDAISSAITISLNVEGMKFLRKLQQKSRKIEKEYAVTYSGTKKLDLATDGVEIQADSISFSYADGPSILNNISFKLKKGDFLLIKGPSGSGKSTLAAIILNLLRPTKGHIKINGINYSDLSHDFSEWVGYVGPEPYLISGTVRDNLLFGNIHAENKSDREVLEALDAVEMREPIEALNNGLNTELLESTQLSSGQKQRLSIARALLRNPKILVLDEATSNLDENTENTIVSEITKLKPSMATIAITHRNAFDGISTQTLEMGT